MKQKSSKRLILFGCQIVLLLTVIPAAGQIRLHDPASDELAKKTRDAFAEFSKGDANVFETMLSNTMSLKEATLAHLYDLNRQGTRDAVNLVPVQTWKQLRGRVKKTQDDFLVAYNAARTILDEKAAQAPDLKAALKLAQDELTALKAKRKKKADELDVEQPDLKKLKDSLDKLKDALVASTKPVNRLSDLENEFNSLKSVWAGIASVKEFWDAAQKSTNAPGLQLTILDVAVTHQQAKVDRLKLDLEEADAAQKRGERIAQRLQVVWFKGEVETENGATIGEAKAGLFGQVYKGIGSVADQDERVLVTIGKLAKEAEGEVGTKLDATMKLRNLLDILGRYTTLAGYQKYLLLSDAIEAGVDTHLFSIRRSAINTSDREMLVSYGLDGLAAYHAGGLRPEQIANFFRAAQSIALGVLAGRDK
jgi:hypothetical protein